MQKLLWAWTKKLHAPQSIYSEGNAHIDGNTKFWMTPVLGGSRGTWMEAEAASGYKSIDLSGVSHKPKRLKDSMKLRVLIPVIRWFTTAPAYDIYHLVRSSFQYTNQDAEHVSKSVSKLRTQMKGYLLDSMNPFWYFGFYIVLTWTVKYWNLWQRSNAAFSVLHQEVQSHHFNCKFVTTCNAVTT